MAARGSYVQAKKLNADALQEIENLKLPHPHLAADIMDQTLCIEQAKVSLLEPQKSKQITFIVLGYGTVIMAYQTQRILYRSVHAFHLSCSQEGTSHHTTRHVQRKCTLLHISLN
jgi:hypothetical protein